MFLPFPILNVVNDTDYLRILMLIGGNTEIFL
jgi:hypothetical protein